MKKGKLKKGFTLVELLVVVVILAIIVMIVVMVINPGERINEGKDARASSDVRSIASSVQSCIVVELRKRNPPGDPYDEATCGSGQYLVDEDFAKNVPEGTQFLVDTDNDKVCVYEEGRSGKYASWQSETGQVVVSPYGVATCD